MKRRNVIASLFSLLTFGLASAAVEKRQICRQCGDELLIGDTVAPVKAKDGFTYIHFSCAFREHVKDLQNKK